MLILGRGGAVAGFSAVDPPADAPDGFIIRKRLPSGLMSHGVDVIKRGEGKYVPLKRILGFPRLNVGSVSTSTGAALTAALPRKINIVVNWLEELKQRVPVK